jgi:hypothetical protein
MGLVPSTYQSGDKLRHGRITKQATRFFILGIIEATQVAIANSKYFRKHYEQIKQRSGIGPTVIATIRRLLEVIFKVLTQKRVYYEINRNRILAVALTKF